MLVQNCYSRALPGSAGTEGRLLVTCHSQKLWVFRACVSDILEDSVLRLSSHFQRKSMLSWDEGHIMRRGSNPSQRANKGQAIWINPESTSRSQAHPWFLRLSPCSCTGFYLDLSSLLCTRLACGTVWKAEAVFSQAPHGSLQLMWPLSPRKATTWNEAREAESFILF